jgi:hypothetical protein
LSPADPSCPRRQPPLSPLAGRGEVRGLGISAGVHQNAGAMLRFSCTLIPRAPLPTSPRKRGEEQIAPFGEHFA